MYVLDSAQADSFIRVVPREPGTLSHKKVTNVFYTRFATNAPDPGRSSAGEVNCCTEQLGGRAAFQSACQSAKRVEQNSGKTPAATATSRRCTHGLGQIWCSLCSLRGRGCATSCHERRVPSLPPSRSHGYARIARERPPGWILACLLGRLLQREQDHRSLGRIVADACQSKPAQAHEP